MSIQIQKEGRRHYLIGNTFSIKDQIKSAGGHWDPDKRAWWVSKPDVAAKFTQTSLDFGEAAPAPKEETVHLDSRVIRGRAMYEGKAYYLLAQGISQASGRPYAKLCYRDGSKVFWAKDASQVVVQKTYEECTSINALRAYAERAKERQAEHGCGCSCHGAHYCTCAKGFCSYHHDGCDRCGCEC